MKIIYAQKSAGIDEDGLFQNPKYFERPDSNATSVIVYGDFPEIKAAYSALNVEVEERQLKQRVDLGGTSVAVSQLNTISGQATINEISGELKETKARLQKAVDELAVERQVHIEFYNNVEAMQARIDELKASAIDKDVTSSPSDVKDEVVDETQQSASLEEKVIVDADKDYTNWTIPQIKDLLASKEIGFKPSATKPELLALIPQE
ncbi:hypothetical protein KPC_0333 [Acinetobacter stercoris]|uniref:HeH/LEM domain protein n=1 Tax=Acinetobacter stercoris TaxID=2126983 RepID=A0A2U3MUW7_9GAMM|nr:hypothetical protein KPC_0333 [Acinetobacter stercoris]